MSSKFLLMRFFSKSSEIQCFKLKSIKKRRRSACWAADVPIEAQVALIAAFSLSVFVCTNYM